MAERVKVFKPMWGVGPIYLQEFGVVNAPLYHIGNTSELTLTHDESTTELPDYDTLGGGTYAEVRRINSVTAGWTMHDINADNIAMATRGSRATVTSGTVTDESQTAYATSLVRLNNPAAADVEVTDSTGSTTYTGYEVTGAGIKILETGDIATAIAALGEPTDGLPILVAYSYGEYQEIQPMTESGKQYHLVFDGMNEADSGNPVIVDIWKLNLGVLSELALKSDGLASMPVEGKLLKDTSKGADESAYYRIQQV